MASNYDITMRQFNGVDYDTLYPKTIPSQIDGLSNYMELQSSGLYLPQGAKSGGILDMNGHRITNVANPVNDNDAVNKSYCDNIGNQWTQIGSIRLTNKIGSLFHIFTLTESQMSQMLQASRIRFRGHIDSLTIPSWSSSDNPILQIFKEYTDPYDGIQFLYYGVVGNYDVAINNIDFNITVPIIVTQNFRKTSYTDITEEFMLFYHKNDRGEYSQKHIILNNGIPFISLTNNAVITGTFELSWQ